MMALVHYTTHDYVYSCFSKDSYKIENIDYKDTFNEIDTYYKKYNTCQEVLLFIVQYYDSSKNKRYHSIGKIKNINDSIYMFEQIKDDNIVLEIINSLYLDTINKYSRELYYKYLPINLDEQFCKIDLNNCRSKIKLKYYSWEELLSDTTILHKKLMDILFDQKNVINLMSDYNYNDFNGNANHIKSIYFSALKSIGFISKENNKLNLSSTVLHGDIGEFLMSMMIKKYIGDINQECFIFPKLVFKTSPNSPVHGCDGTFYNKTTKEIFYNEAKFYQNLSVALNRAVESSFNHKDTEWDFINTHLSYFRNLSNDKRGEFIEISSDVKENLIIFLMCEDKYKKDDVLEVITKNKKLNSLLMLNKIYIFVLPILDKESFLKEFEIKSEDIKRRFIDGK